MLLPASFTPLWSTPASLAPSGLWFIFDGDKLLGVQGAGGIDSVALPEGDAPALPLEGVRCVGLLEGRACWAARLQGPPGTGLLLEPLRRLFDRLPDELVAVAGRASQVLGFDRTHRFCGACATPTEETDGGHARRCPTCSLVCYPRLSPAMMVLVTRPGPKGPELLLATGARFTTRIYSALAGFVEPSESLEACVHREVEEEVGLKVRNLRYFGSECWPFPHSLMVAFLADYAGGEIRCQDGEIVDAQWFTADRLPTLPHRLSVSRRLIEHALHGDVAASP